MNIRDRRRGAYMLDASLKAPAITKAKAERDLDLVGVVTLKSDLKHRGPTKEE